MGLLYIIYRGNVSKGLIGGIYKGSVCITRGANEDHIGSGPKVCNSILGNLYSKTKDLNSNFNSILPIDGWINRKIELDNKIILTSLCQLYTE